MPTYTPKPIDTSNVTLPESLTPLLERLAENTHEVWSAQRIKDGWRYGMKRKHTCLGPFKDRP